jgi:hypothetical protein
MPTKLLHGPFPAGLGKAFSQFRIAHQQVDFFGEVTGKLVRSERLKGAFLVLFQWHQEPGLPVDNHLRGYLYSCRLNPIVDKGGNVKQSECERPCQGIGSACIPPQLPMLPPP